MNATPVVPLRFCMGTLSFLQLQVPLPPRQCAAQPDGAEGKDGCLAAEHKKVQGWLSTRHNSPPYVQARQGITFPSLPCLPSFLQPTLFSQRTSIYPNDGHFRDAELLSSHEYCQLKSAHTHNAGCEAEPCRPASIQTPSAIIRVISMSSERAFISQEFRQSHNASFLHEGYVTNSNGMRFFFCCFYKLLIQRKAPQMFSASVIKYVMLWKICYLQLKTTTMNKIELWQVTCFKKKIAYSK